MAWLQIRVQSDPEHVETISEAMMEVGASAVTVQDAADQPLYEPPPGATPLWQHNTLIALFDADTDVNAIQQQLQTMLGSQLMQGWHVDPLEDKDWTREWMADYKPMRFGQRLWIVPSWTTPPDPGAVNILLDPGLAFGTGTHPTTAMCLTWLDAHPPQQQTVLDYGCGSGILAIAAAKLGASAVLGVDNDPQALQATRDNAVRNAVAQLNVYTPDTLPTQQVDVLLANILAGPLHELADRLAALVRPGGSLVLSGIVSNQAEALLQCYRQAFELDVAATQDEWVCLAGRRY